MSRTTTAGMTIHEYPSSFQDGNYGNNNNGNCGGDVDGDYDGNYYEKASKCGSFALIMTSLDSTSSYNICLAVCCPCLQKTKKGKRRTTRQCCLSVMLCVAITAVIDGALACIFIFLLMSSWSLSESDALDGKGPPFDISDVPWVDYNFEWVRCQKLFFIKQSFIA